MIELRKVSGAAAVFALLFSFVAQAQTVVTVTSPPIQGYGTLAATNTSALLSTLTASAGSAAWPVHPGTVNVQNAASSAGILYVCPLGGVCSASVGIPVAAGASYRVYQPATAMTVIAASTATIWAQW